MKETCSQGGEHSLDFYTSGISFKLSVGSPLDSATPCPDSQCCGERADPLQPCVLHKTFLSARICKRAPCCAPRCGRRAGGGGGDGWQAQGSLCSLGRGKPCDGGESLAKRSSKCHSVAWPPAPPHLTAPALRPAPHSNHLPKGRHLTRPLPQGLCSAAPFLCAGTAPPLGDLGNCPSGHFLQEDLPGGLSHKPKGPGAGLPGLEPQLHQL